MNNEFLLFKFSNWNRSYLSVYYHGCLCGSTYELPVGRIISIVMYLLTCMWLRALTLHGLTVVTETDWSLSVYSFSVSPSAVPVRLCVFVF